MKFPSRLEGEILGASPRDDVILEFLVEIMRVAAEGGPLLEVLEDVDHHLDLI
jgi:hypothetical protein